jgi:hypothetical protein
MHSLADIACFQKWATARSCVAKTDAWQVFALHNLTVAIETTSTTDDLLFIDLDVTWSSSVVQNLRLRILQHTALVDTGHKARQLG